MAAARGIRRHLAAARGVRRHPAVALRHPVTAACASAPLMTLARQARLRLVVLPRPTPLLTEESLQAIDWCLLTLAQR